MQWTGDVEDRLHRHLRMFAQFTTEESQNRLLDAVLDGLAEIRMHKPWPQLEVAQASLSTTEGTLGPYALPATFFAMAREKRLYRWGYSDETGIVLQPIKDSETQEYPVYLSETDNKLYFRRDPGTATYTLQFVAQFSRDPADIETILAPYTEEFYLPLRDFVEASFLRVSDDTKQESENLTAQGFARLDKVWEKYQAGRSKPRMLNPRGPSGASVLDGLGSAPNIRDGRRIAGNFPRWRQWGRV